MSLSNISVVIMVKNAQHTIKKCLDSLVQFDEIVIYLNNSTDKTKEIASLYTNVVIHEGEFEGFGDTKNRAAKYASNDWILSLDSDEILNKKLIKEIKQQDFTNIKNIYKLKRDNYFLNHKTQSSDYINRIYNRKHTKFNSNRVHEKVIVQSDSHVIDLKYSFKHLNITDINQTLTKMIQYTDLGAKDKQTCFFIIVILKPIFAFFKTYILEGHCLKGWVGFALGVNAANRRYYKYLKQYINCKNSKK